MTRVLLVATYELGHQPGNLARPAALLAAAGHDVRMIDTSVEPWDPELAEWADAVACSVPMHTATRLARDLLATIDRPTCCYGLYAHLCTDIADRVISGEYEDALLLFASQVAPDALAGNGRDRASTRWACRPSSWAAPTPAGRDPRPSRSADRCPRSTAMHTSWRGREGAAAGRRRSRRRAAARTGAGTALSRWSTTAASGCRTSARSSTTSTQLVGCGRQPPELRRPRLPQRTCATPCASCVPCTRRTRR